MAERLTPQQQIAVDDRGGKLLVSAAAGSGKTKVLVDRLLKYITDPLAPANIDDFLIITYTKAAAAELRGKIAAKLSEHIAADPANRHLQRQLQRLYLAKISTVHAFCADVLRDYAYRLDIPADFRVADENECIQLRTRAMEHVLEDAYAAVSSDPDFQAFIDTQGLGRSDALVPEIIEKVYDSARCHLNPDAWLADCVKNAEVSAVTDAAQTVWGQYLIADLFSYLDEQIAAMTRCATAVEAIPGLEKPAAVLHGTVLQLRHLRQSATWDDIVSRSTIDYGRLIFPKKANDPSVTDQVKAVRVTCKDGLAKKLRSFANPSEQVILDLEQSAAAARGLVALVERFSESFDRLKRGRRILDFGDLEHNTLDLLLGKHRAGATAAACEIGGRFREIMVDEYQDSNAVQDAIFSALTARGQSLFMVGDVKQSIYQFRLADPGIFLEKYAAYVPAEIAEPGQGRKVLLSSNFRSGGGVISAVNDVFGDCMSETVGGLVYGHEEALREGVPHIPIPDPEVELHVVDVQEDTYLEEAAFVAEHIQMLLDGNHFVRQGDQLRTVTADDIVILLRSPGSMGMAFQYALRQRGIRCASGGSVDLLLTEEVGTLRAVLQIISNPRQDIPLIAAMASPVFGFTADDLAAIRGIDRHCCMYDAVCKSHTPRSQHFLEVLSILRMTAGMRTLPELLERIFFLTHLDTVYASMSDGQNRKANLQIFYQLAADFSAAGTGDLDRFLEYLDTLAQKGLIVGSEQPTGGCVTIMSIHKSKGLEFPVVFLCGLSHRFNRESQQAQVLCDRELGLGLSCIDTKNRVRYSAISKCAIAAKIAADSLSEEMRVLYVAMTRARDRLIMTYASGSLQSDIADIVNRMDISDTSLMTRDVSNPGQWVLYSALRRTEAGALFSLGGKPAETVVRESPWRITVQTAKPMEHTAFSEQQNTELPDGTLELLNKALSFRYPYAAATTAPSKQTATQRKGRLKDQEAAENTGEPMNPVRNWRKPAFSAGIHSGKAYGSAIHAVLQYIRYEECTDVDSVKTEIKRLIADRFITPEQGDLVDCGKIATFFATPFGVRLRTGTNVLREFKFSVLDDAAVYGSALAGEHVLLQGVIDCALVEEDGITVVDFKTDRVTEDTINEVTRRYRSQVETYADALSRIYEMPVKAKALYFFHMDRFQWLD